MRRLKIVQPVLLAVGLQMIALPPLRADVPVFHPRWGNANTNYTRVAYSVDERRYLTLAELRVSITLSPPNATIVSNVFRARLPYDDWPNVFDLTAMALEDAVYFEAFLDAVLRHESDAGQVRQDITNATARGERVFLARDFISRVVLGQRVYHEVPYALLIWLDGRRAGDIKASPQPELGTLRDDHVRDLNAFLRRNLVGPDTEWHLCLRGNTNRSRYDAVVVRQVGLGQFTVPRMAPDCGSAPGTAADDLSGFPWIPPATNPPPPFERIPPPIEPPRNPPVFVPRPVPVPDAHPRPGRLWPGPDGPWITPQPPQQGRPEGEPPPDTCLDQLAQGSLPGDAELEALVQDTDIALDDTYREINRLIAEEKEALEVWNRQFAGKPVPGPTTPDEPGLAQGEQELSDGTVASLATCVAPRLAALAGQLGGQVLPLRRQDPYGHPYTVPELMVALPCGDCDTGPYDVAEYERLRDGLEAAVDAAAQELADMRARSDDLYRAFPHLRLLNGRGTVWDNVFRQGITIPRPLFGPEGLRVFNPQSFVNMVRDALRTGEVSMDEAIQIAIAIHALAAVQTGGLPTPREVMQEGLAAFQERVRQAALQAEIISANAYLQIRQFLAAYGEQLKQAWQDDLAHMQFENGPLTPDEIRIMMDPENLTPAERAAWNELQDLRAKMAYQRLLLTYLRNTLAKLEKQRADCLRRYRELCVNPAKCVGFTLHQLARAFRQFVQSARASGGTTWSYEFASLNCDCESYDAILANPGAYPAAFVQFIRCLKEQDCPSPETPLPVHVVETPGGRVELTPPPGTEGYPAGTEVLARAVPDAGFAFVDWAEFLAGAGNPVTLTVQQPVTIQPVFARLLQLEVLPASGGTVQSSDLTEPILPGTVLILEAQPVPSAGLYFAGWTGAGVAANENPLLLLMETDRQIQPQFAPFARPETEIRVQGQWSFSGGFLLQIQSAAPFLLYEVQASADLRLWQPIGLAPADNGMAEFRDLEAFGSHRFYRARPADLPPGP